MRFETSETLPRYIKNVNSYLPITKEEERELAIKIQADPKDKASRDKLVCANLKFVITLANKFIGQGVPIDDLINEGNVGLIKAAENFKPAKNVKFITYAQFWIRKHLNGAIMNYSKIVRLPANQEYDIYKKRMAGESINTHSVELDRPIHEGSEDTVGDVILKTNPMDTHDRDHDKYQVSVLMSILTTDEKNVVSMKYGLDGNGALDNRQIADSFNTTTGKIAQILKSARAKMMTRAEVIEA